MLPNAMSGYPEGWFNFVWAASVPCKHMPMLFLGDGVK